MSGGTTLKLCKALLAPAEEGVALDIAPHFHLGVEGERVSSAELVNLHGMIDYELGGKQRINFLCVAAEIFDGVAHGGKINHGRNAGEILEQHARGHEGDFFFGGAPGL